MFCDGKGGKVSPEGKCIVSQGGGGGGGGGGQKGNGGGGGNDDDTSSPESVSKISEVKLI